jgi:uncharacterized membrane protein YbhN (UPF0104 family)
MRDERVRPSAAIVTIMVERIYDMMAVVLMFAINLVWFKAPPTLQKDFTKVRAVGIGLLVGTMIGIVLLTWFRKNSTFVIAGFTKVFDRLDFIPSRISKLAISILEQLARALRVLVNLKELAETITWTAVLWLGVALANLLIIRAFGVTFGFSETIFVMGWSLAGSLVPTPGGAAGAFHAATAAGLIFLGVAPETAAGISIVMHVIDFGPALLFGFFYIIRGDLSFSKLRALASPEAVEHVVEDEDLLPDNANTKQQTLGGVLTD